jgi:hypothetical protein
VITEVFYSPQSKSWIEVYNNTNGNLDLTKYKVLDSGAATNGHGVSFISGNAQLAPGSFAVIAKDPATLPSLSVPIFKSALAAKTTGDTISLKDASGNVTDTFSFGSSLGANGDGNSLQRFDTGWLASAPTPGATNILPPVVSSDDSTSTSTATATDAATSAVAPIYSSHYSFIPISDAPVQKLTASAGRNRLGYIGVPLAFKALTDTNDPNASYFWSFGDGGEAQGKEVSHTYLYPGTYTLVLNVKLFEYEAVSRATVKIVEPKISITNADPDRIELFNDSEFEINLYGFRLREGTKTFEFPLDTILGPNTKVIFPKTVTKLDPINSSYIKIEPKTDPIPADVAPTEIVKVADVSVRAESAEEIQAVADKLVILNLELFAMKNPTREVAAQALPKEDAIPGTAAALQAIPNATSSWIHTLEHFFLR